MKSAPWGRTERIREVRARIWSYVTPPSAFEEPDLLVAAGLLGWPDQDVSALAELHFVLSPSVGRFLEEMPMLVRRMRSSVMDDERLQRGRIDGPIRWGATLARRSIEGSADVFVTAPARRAHQTAENELLVHVIDGIVTAARSTGWGETSARNRPAEELRERLAQAEKWQQHRPLAALDRVRPTAASVNRIRSGRFSVRYAAALRAYDEMHLMLESQDREAIARAIERTALVTASDPTLFELLMTFATIDALREQGWELSPIHKFAGRLRVEGARPGGGRLTLWYQSIPGDLASASDYKAVLRQHGFTNQGARRPDLVLRWEHGGAAPRTLLIECKLREDGGVAAGARDALGDLMSYRREFASALPSQGVYGLGVTWGRELSPAGDSAVLLCSPDQLAEALLLVMGNEPMPLPPLPSSDAVVNGEA